MRPPLPAHPTSRLSFAVWGCLHGVPNGYCGLKGTGVSCAIDYSANRT